MKKMIEVNNVSKTYGYLGNKVKILDNISFTVDQGEFIGIMGPSGAGKSTLLNVLSTIVLPNQGTISIANQNILRMRDNQLSDFRRDNLSFIFQTFNLISTLNAKDNILLPLAINKMSVTEMNQRLVHVTQLLGIADFLLEYPATISVGQRQRVAAARALITQPKIIFADEPTGSLDSKSATELLHCLSIMNQQDNATILMVTHDPYTASYCNRILFIKDGTIFSEVVRQGSRKDFFKRVIEMQAAIGGGNQADVF